MSIQTEIEVKFVRIDLDDMRERLTTAGATLEQPMRLMRRSLSNTVHDDRWEFLRVRDEGNKVTLTFKKFDGSRELAVDSAQEIEIEVSDFQKTIDLLTATGLKFRSFQESKRETWRLGDVEIVLDVWPWLDPCMEIEGPTEARLKEVAEQLHLDWNQVVFGDIMAAYRAQYPHLELHQNVGDLPRVRFDDPLPSLLESQRAATPGA